MLAVAEHLVYRMQHLRDADAGKAIRRVTGAARRRQADTVARAARQIDADDAIARAAGSVTCGIRRAEHRDDRRTDRVRQVHRAGVAGDEEVDLGEDRRKRDQVGAAAQIEHAAGGQLPLDQIDVRTIARRAGENDDRGANSLKKNYGGVS